MILAASQNEQNSRAFIHGIERVRMTTATNLTTRTMGLFVSVVHISMIVSLTYALFMIRSLDDAFKIFVILAVLLLSFIYFQTCIMNTLEKHYKIGTTTTLEFFKERCMIELDTVENTDSLKVILLGLSLLVVKICTMIIFRA